MIQGRYSVSGVMVGMVAETGRDRALLVVFDDDRDVSYAVSLCECLVLSHE
jgi:hypothetical protein